MMNNINHNKKAILGDTIAWLSAIFLIVLLLMIYIGVVYFLSEKKAVLGNYDLKVTGGYYGDDFSELQSFYAFLNTPVTYKDERARIVDIIFREKSKEGNIELYNAINNTMSFQCPEYSLWIPDYSFNKNGMSLNPYIKGQSYDFKNPNVVSDWNDFITYRPDISQMDVMIRYSTLKNCTGGVII